MWCSQGLSPQGDESPTQTDENHAGRLCGFASRSAGNEGGRGTLPSSAGPIEPILEQSRRTGPPPNQTADSADAGIQTIRQRGSHYIRGIELVEKIKKGQFETGKFGDRKSTMSELWNAALAA